MKFVKINSKGCEMSTTLVTVAEYAAYLASHTLVTPPPNWAEQQKNPTCPVVSLTPVEMEAYATSIGCRLPTEDEWLDATQGEKRDRKYPWGNDKITPGHANYAETGIGHPTPVGSFPLGNNPEGVSDLLGNVWEAVKAR